MRRLLVLSLLLITGCESPFVPDRPFPLRPHDSVGAYATSDSVFVSVSAANLHSTQQAFYLLRSVQDGEEHAYDAAVWAAHGDSIPIYHLERPSVLVGFGFRHWVRDGYVLSLPRAAMVDFVAPAPFEFDWVSMDGRLIYDAIGTCVAFGA